jgi:diguanylate cyclase (GGDEF)-like protein/PAS domain S-box-containing protein
LHIRVSLNVAAAALVVVLLSSYFFYHNSYKDSFAQSERSVQQLLETVRAPAAISAYVGNRELAQQVVGGLTQNDIVAGAQILANREIIGMEGKHPDEALEQDLVSLKLVSPFDETETVGELLVVPNISLIALRARDAALATTASLATLAVVVALLVLIMVYWMMTRPLTTLSNNLHNITPGDGNRLNALGMHRSNEIGLLVSDINSLLNTVEKMLGEERELRHRVEQLETRFRGIFEDSSAGIFLITEQGQLVTANPAFFAMIGLENIHEQNLSEENLITQVFLDKQQAQSLIQLALISKRPCSADLRIAGADAEQHRWVHCIFSPAGNQHHSNTVEGVMYDVTQRKKAEERTRELAEKDSLTGLANRQSAEVILNQLISQSAIMKKNFSIMMIDLDRFKHINDTYGHDAGDQVLRIIADRLRKQVRDTDMVARLGGDEFFILLKETDNPIVEKRIALQILEAQTTPIEVQPGIYEKIGLSIGIAHYPEHGDNETTLRKHADQALYSVKRRGKNSYALYDPSLNDWPDSLQEQQTAEQP